MRDDLQAELLTDATQRLGLWGVALDDERVGTPRGRKVKEPAPA